MFMPTSSTYEGQKKMCHSPSHQFLGNRRWPSIGKLISRSISCFNKNPPRWLPSGQAVLQVWIFKLFFKVDFRRFKIIWHIFSLLRTQYRDKDSNILNTGTNWRTLGHPHTGVTWLICLYFVLILFNLTRVRTHLAFPIYVYIYVLVYSSKYHYILTSST